MSAKDPDLYLVRRISREQDSFEVAKFDKGQGIVPTNVYEVALRTDKNLAWCSCPGFRSMQFKSLVGDDNCSDHKHIKVVGAFRALNEPLLCVFWFDSQGNVQHKEFGIPMEAILNVDT